MPKTGPNTASLPDDAAIVTVEQLAQYLADLHCGDASLHIEEARTIIAKARAE